MAKDRRRNTDASGKGPTIDIDPGAQPPRPAKPPPEQVKGRARAAKPRGKLPIHVNVPPPQLPIHVNVPPPRLPIHVNDPPPELPVGVDVPPPELPPHVDVPPPELPPHVDVPPPELPIHVDPPPEYMVDPAVGRLPRRKASAHGGYGWQRDLPDSRDLAYAG